MGRTTTTTTTATMSSLRTPSPTKKKSSSSRPQPPRNKIEASPNNRAKCHGCGSKIVKGEERYGIVEVNEYGRTQRYYHPRCCPEAMKAKLPSPEKMQDLQIVQQRRALANQLYELRRLFAVALDREDEVYKIWKDKTQDELVLRMPTTREELLQVWGIAEQKAQNYGDAIIAVIRQYQREHPQVAGTIPANSNHNRNNKKQKQTKKKSKRQNEDNDGEEEELVAMGETLSCEEIVRRKFKHAEENGYVISVE